MALSNIFREPRREITESLVGLGVAGAVITGIGYWSYWCVKATGGTVLTSLPIAMFMVAITSIAAIAVLWVLGYLFLAATHAIGEDICDILQRRGVHLRPRKRY